MTQENTSARSLTDSKVSLPPQLAAHLSTPPVRNAYLLTISSGARCPWGWYSGRWPRAITRRKWLGCSLPCYPDLLVRVSLYIQLHNVLIRFIQPAGRQAGRLIALASAVSVIASVPVSLLS